VANVSALVFRQITPAGFFNINKQPGTEDRGGGQSYIDVPVKNVDLATWHLFFDGVEPKATKSGPLWTVEVKDHRLTPEASFVGSTPVGGRIVAQENPRSAYHLNLLDFSARKPRISLGCKLSQTDNTSHGTHGALMILPFISNAKCAPRCALEPVKACLKGETGHCRQS